MSFLGRILTSLLLMRPCAVPVDGQNMLRHGFSSEYLGLTHPSSGRLLREEWTAAMHANYERWNCFHDTDACVQHVNLLACHHLTSAEASAIAASGLTVCVHVALRDRLVPTKRQWELAKCLQASRIISPLNRFQCCELGFSCRC